MSDVYNSSFVGVFLFEGTALLGRHCVVADNFGFGLRELPCAGGTA